MSVCACACVLELDDLIDGIVVVVIVVVHAVVIPWCGCVDVNVWMWM